nr:MAG TPA: hypothetical protein [Bacteriophage sp.]
MARKNKNCPCVSERLNRVLNNHTERNYRPM